MFAVVCRNSGRVSEADPEAIESAVVGDAVEGSVTPDVGEEADA